MKAMILMLVLSLTIGMGGAVAVNAEPTTQPSLKLEDCPKAVQDTLKKEVGGGKIQELTKEKEGGKTTYNADAHIDGKNYFIVVAEDGKLVSMTQE